MSEHLRHDHRDYDPEKVRPRDLDEALMTPQEERLERASNNIENAGKIIKPVWALIVGLIAGGIWFGSFYTDYKYNAENGSPAMRKLMAGQQEQLSKQQTQIDQLSYVVQDVKRRQDNDDDRRTKP